MDTGPCQGLSTHCGVLPSLHGRQGGMHGRLRSPGWCGTRSRLSWRGLMARPLPCLVSFRLMAQPCRTSSTHLRTSRSASQPLRCRRGDGLDVFVVLVWNGLNVDRLLPDHYFEGAPTRAPPIALAAYLESAVVDTLIALVASVNQEDSQGHRPLAYAMRDSTGGLVSRLWRPARTPTRLPASLRC